MLLNIFKISILLSVSFVLAQGAAADQVYTKLGNKMYYFSDDKLNWNQANVACALTDKGSLVSIETESEFEELKNYLHEHRDELYNRVWWTSGYRSGKTFIWKAIEKPFTFADWQRGQPDNYNNEENCVTLRRTNYVGSHLYQLSDIECDRSTYFICEKSLYGHYSFDNEIPYDF